MCRYCNGYFPPSKSDLIPTEGFGEFPVILGIGSSGGGSMDDGSDYMPNHADIMAFDFHSGDMLLSAAIRYCPMCGRRLFGADDEIRLRRMEEGGQ